MQTRAKQGGMTFWGLLMIAAIFIFFVVMFFKLLPPYMQYGKVKAAIDGIAGQPGAGNMEKAEIKAALERRFSIEDVNDLDVNKILTVEKKPGATLIRITYEKRVPLAYNITALIEFDHSAQATNR